MLPIRGIGAFHHPCLSSAAIATAALGYWISLMIACNNSTEGKLSLRRSIFKMYQ
jgi:hypothetical protein